MDIKSYFKYWGKAKKDPEQGGANYHLLPYHSLDVAAVGWLLLDPTKLLCQRLAKQIDVKPQWLQAWFCFCLALHDLGKFSRAFQNLSPKLRVSNLPQDVTDSWLRETFGQYGTILDTCLPIERVSHDTGPRGFVSCQQACNIP